MKGGEKMANFERLGERPGGIGNFGPEATSFKVSPIRVFHSEIGSAGATPDGEDPVRTQILGRLVPILVKTMRLKPGDLLENPTVSLVENKQDPNEDTLGASSLQGLRAKNAVEREWGFKVPDDQLETFLNLDSIVDRIAVEQAKAESSGQTS